MAESFAPTLRKHALDVRVHLSGVHPEGHPEWTVALQSTRWGKHLAAELPAHAKSTNSARPLLCLATQAPSSVRVRRTSSCCPLLLINDSAFHALSKEVERGTHNRTDGCHSIKLYAWNLSNVINQSYPNIFNLFFNFMPKLKKKKKTEQEAKT